MSPSEVKKLYPEAQLKKLDRGEALYLIGKADDIAVTEARITFFFDEGQLVRIAIYFLKQGFDPNIEPPQKRLTRKHGRPKSTNKNNEETIWETKDTSIVLLPLSLVYESSKYAAKKMK